MEKAIAPLGVTVRELQLEEYDDVLSLWRQAGLPIRPAGRDRPEKVAVELRRGTAVFLVAEAEGRLVGVVLGTHDGRKGWINRLAVAPDFCHRGIARLLVARAEACLESQGIEIVAALIESGNDASMRFFDRLGYTHDPGIHYFSKRRSSDT